MILKIGKVENFRFYKSSIRLKDNTSNEFYKLWVFFKIQTRMFHRSRPIEATVSHDAWHCNVDTENANINVDLLK